MFKNQQLSNTYGLIGLSFLISLAFTASGFIFSRPFLALFILLGLISAIIFFWATRVWVQKKQTLKDVLLPIIAMVLAPAFGVAFTLYVPLVLGVPTNALGPPPTHPYLKTRNLLSSMRQFLCWRIDARLLRHRLLRPKIQLCLRYLAKLIQSTYPLESKVAATIT